MASVKVSSSPRRTVKEGYGIIGVNVQFTMTQILHLQSIKAGMQQIAIEEGDEAEESETYTTCVKAIAMLDYIIRDIPSPNDADIWKEEGQPNYEMAS